MTRQRTRPRPDLKRLRSEKSNPKSANLDLQSSLQVVRIINAEDARVARSVRRALPTIARAVDLIAAALAKGGRLIYVGAGTSGRIAALDAAECPPTFNSDPRMVQFVMAGGRRALGAAVEASEDSRRLGQRDMAKLKPGRKDVVVGVAASGRTPFTVAALHYARQHGATTIAVTCNRKSLLERVAHLTIVTDVGPEVLAGSSRMKAGTAQKMVLNMLSTGAMTRLGYVYGNLMVNVFPKNEKLRERGLGILQQAVGINRRKAKQALKAAGNRVPVALVMLKSGVTRGAAEDWLKATGGHVRKSIALASRPGLQNKSRYCAAEGFSFPIK